MRHRILLLILIAGLAAATADAEVYRIILRGNERLLSSDAPVPHGRVFLFRDFSTGRLRSVPRDAVERIVPVPATRSVGFLPDAERLETAKDASTATVFLGPTGADYDPPERPAVREWPRPETLPDPGRLEFETQMFPGAPPVGGPYGGAYGFGAQGRDRLRRDRGPAGIYRNGSPRTPFMSPGTGQFRFDGGTVRMPIGPEAGGLPTNPNGFPATTLEGPQSGIQPIGPNGYPLLAPPPVPPAGTRPGRRGRPVGQ